jgi:superfamily II DNA/RNA helicase
LEGQTLPQKVIAIHGDKTQQQRDLAIEKFRQEANGIVLIATDVASRGLDISNVELVLNYDMPFQIEDYVHRVGRTGRAGNKGRSVTLFTKKNYLVAQDLI